jgi:hypothetical protein
MGRPLVGSVIAVFTMFLAGCGDLPGVRQPSAKQQKSGQTKVPSDPKPAPARKKQPELVRSNDSSRLPTRTIGRAEEVAMKKVATVIKESLEVGPTLVVWILDSTPSAQEIVRDVSTAACEYYDSAEVRELSAADSRQLLTAIVTFDEDVRFVMDPPSGDIRKVIESFEAITQSSLSREMPFTAIKQALQKYLPLRTDERRELVLVVVTDEAGDDAKVVEELVEPTRRHAIPVYVIGLPAPWGQTNPFAPNPKALDVSSDDSTPTVGPESFLSERVDIENWTAHHGGRINIDLVDSGFGPFALERLCRASRGRFFALRPGLGFGYRGVSARAWPTGDELRFDEKVVSKYAPDYVSEAEYRKLLAENKARAALCEAATLPKVTIEGSPGSRFPKGAEAKMAKQFSAAQQFAARNSPGVDRLHNVLAQGEAERAKLTSPRWQAEFDLAMGRVLANKARLDGYNSMIAALKRGKSFQNPESKEWVLESADHFETESTIRKMAERAKEDLERVIKEHPGTPWAKIAEEELKTPLGWQWKEA